MQRMYTDIQEPMLNATQEQVEYGPQKTYHIATGNFITFILKKIPLKMLHMYDLRQVQFVFKVIAGFVWVIKNLSWNSGILFSRPGKSWNLITFN